MSNLAGFFYPRTATGRASLLPEPPWHYSGDLLTVEYRTDPARVAELLPAPLAPVRKTKSPFSTARLTSTRAWCERP